MVERTSYQWTLRIGLTVTILSGSVKETMLGSWLPIDMTLFGVLMIAALALVKFGSYPYPFPQLVPLFAFLAFWLLHQLLVPETGAYAMEQTGKFLFLTAPLMLAFAAVMTTSRELEIFVQSWLAGAVVVILLAIVSPVGAVAAANQRVGIGDDAGTLGYWAATGFVCCLALLVLPDSPRRSGARVLVTAVGAAIFLYYTIASASRGGLLGLLAGTFALAVLAPGTRKARLLLLAIPVGLLGLMIVATLPELARDRFTIQDGSRVHAWHQAIQIFSDRPFLGGGATAIGDAVYPLNYSHNLLLDAAAGQGILGLLLMLGILTTAWVRVIRFRANPTVIRLGVLYALFLAGAMVSLDINNRFLWLLVVAALLLPVSVATGQDRLGDSEPTGVRQAHRGAPHG